MSAALGEQVQRFRDGDRRRSPWLRLDPLLLLGSVGLIACSAYVVGNATRDDIPGDPNHYLNRQIAYGVVGIALMIFVSRFDYSRLREMKLGIYTAMIGLILLVFAVASATRGSKRWIELPFLRLQPSEVGKLLLVVALSGFVVDRLRRLGDRETTSRIMLLAIVPAMLVVAQPDLGSGLVYLAIAVAILFIAGTKWTHFLAIGAIVAVSAAGVLVAAPAVGIEVLKPYQKDRLTAFVDPTDDPRRQGYQLRQSTVAVGSGEKTGRGPEGATQTKLDFLPEHHTDFVFSVVGEMFGFAGAAFVLSLYALLIWRGLRILTTAKNLYGTLIVAGVVAMLMFQVFVNVGMTLGLGPITGVPLPLMSYGGSSVIVTFLAIGLLQAVHVQGRLATDAKRRELVA
ncbi:MAG TPA: rod shape-determining protein RodA [Thermoleophilaceae bacterium]|jgi:rod shape determining protein RodA